MTDETGGEVRFARDLYQGTAGHYDRYRLPYPDAMLDDLVRRAGVTGQGRLLDLACGTGQLTFPLRRLFREVWAVDREADMVDLVRDKAAAAGAGEIRAVVSDAETLSCEPGYFELAVIGNAFHRLNRDAVARRVLGWLSPGGCLALCWSSGPWAGEAAWQRALAATVDRWRVRLGAEHRAPVGWDLPQQRRPDPQVLSEAGFAAAGRYQFNIGHRWTLAELTGYIRSTSMLPPAVLGDQGAAFDADLAAALGPYRDSDGGYTETVDFAYDLGRKPGS
ncbi:MAG TPA: class I SAM-dependent methyltransferase [Trebonia sp.]